MNASHWSISHLLKVGLGDPGAGGGEEIIPQRHGELRPGPAVSAHVGAGVHRGQAVDQSGVIIIIMTN